MKLLFLSKCLKRVNFHCILLPRFSMFNKIYITKCSFSQISNHVVIFSSWLFDKAFLHWHELLKSDILFIWIWIFRWTFKLSILNSINHFILQSPEKVSSLISFQHEEDFHISLKLVYNRLENFQHVIFW